MSESAPVPGIHSQVGRQTEFEIAILRDFAGCNDLKPIDSKAKPPTPPTADDKAGKAPVVFDDAEIRKAATKSGLADAVAAVLQANRVKRISAEKAEKAAAEERGESQSRTASPSNLRGSKKASTLTSAFKSTGKEASYASKFTAGQDHLSTKREELVKPHCCHYRPQYTAAHRRPPAWDFSERPVTKSKLAPSLSDSALLAVEDGEENEEEGGAFLTGVDTETVVAPAEQPQAKTEMTAMARNTSRGDLGKIGRVHVLMNEHKVTPSLDYLQQDLKAYPRPRNPEWDFAKPVARKSATIDETLPPGQYDVKWSCVHGVPKTGIKFDKAYSHKERPVRCLGYSAPPAVLHPAWQQAPGGCVADNRSYAKDSVRRRITNVNDFDRELPRPAPALASNEYHDKNDPVASAIVLANSLAYNADVADRSVTHRRDIGPDYSTMIPRGKAAVQGSRALSSDVGVRGAVGLGFADSERRRNLTVEDMEARAHTRERADKSCPNFDRTAFYHQTHNKNNFSMGGAPTSRVGKVYGGPGLDSKSGAMKTKSGVAYGFARKAPAPGLCTTTKFGGPSVDRKTRTHEALDLSADWLAAVDDED